MHYYVLTNRDYTILAGIKFPANQNLESGAIPKNLGKAVKETVGEDWHTKFIDILNATDFQVEIEDIDGAVQHLTLTLLTIY